MITNNTNASWRFSLCAALIIFVSGISRAETAYFLMSGAHPIPDDHALVVGQGRSAYESYVIAVSDPVLIQKAREYLAGAARSTYLVPQVKIAAGADSWNRNYAEPGHHFWNWHVTDVIGWTNFDPASPSAAVLMPHLHSRPSRVVQDLLEATSLGERYDNITLVYFPLVMELSAERGAEVVNISTRAWAGTNERVLIVGFVVQGGEPRNVLIRAIGPSLAALGVTEALADPRLIVYRGAVQIAENDDWPDGNFTRQPILQTSLPQSPPWYDWLFPLNTKEAAIRLSLPAGAYTVHVSGRGGEGIAMAEVFDFDALAPR